MSDLTLSRPGVDSVVEPVVQEVAFFSALLNCLQPVVSHSASVVPVATVKLLFWCPDDYQVVAVATLSELMAAAC